MATLPGLPQNEDDPEPSDLPVEPDDGTKLPGKPDDGGHEPVEVPKA